MSKTAAHTKSTNKSAITHSNASLAERQNSLGAHVCIQREASERGVQPHASLLVREVLNSPGQPLDSETRSQMEPRFGYDFSGVRVHTDDNAAESAKTVNAKAYTAGTHVAFGAGAYAPSSRSGQQLIAHELTHVVQQASGPVAATRVVEGLSVSHPADRFEQEAKRSSISVGTGRGSRGEKSLAALPANQPAAFQTSIQRADTDLSSGVSHTAFVGGLVSAAAGVWSAISAQRQADTAKDALGVSKEQLAEAKKQNVIGQEALETAEGQATTIEGLNVTHATVPDLHPADAKSITTDSMTVPILEMGVGTEDSAKYRLRLQLDKKNQIRGGNTEEEDAQGYPGGFAGSNANITFSTSQISASPDSLLVQFRGINVAAKRKAAQRVHGELTISAPKWDSQVKTKPKGATTPGKGPWALIPDNRKPTSEKQPSPPKNSSGNTPAPTQKGTKK